MGLWAAWHRSLSQVPCITRVDNLFNMFVHRMLEEQAKCCSLCKEGDATGKVKEKEEECSLLFRDEAKPLCEGLERVSWKVSPENMITLHLLWLGLNYPWLSAGYWHKPLDPLECSRTSLCTLSSIYIFCPTQRQTKATKTASGSTLVALKLHACQDHLLLPLVGLEVVKT